MVGDRKQVGEQAGDHKQVWDACKEEWSLGQLRHTPERPTVEEDENTTVKDY